MPLQAVTLCQVFLVKGSANAGMCGMMKENMNSQPFSLILEICHLKLLRSN